MKWSDMKRPQLQREVAQMYAGCHNPAGGWGKFSNAEILDLLHAGNRARKNDEPMPIIPMPGSLGGHTTEATVTNGDGTTTTVEVKNGVDTSAATQLAELLAKLAGGNATVDMTQVEALVDSKLSELGKARRVVIERSDRPEVEVGLAHKQLPELLQELEDGNNVFLVGPAASGKTHAAEQAAKALGLGYSAQSVCMQTTKSDLLGFVHAGGDVVRTGFRDAYEHGWLKLLDEVDNGNANVLNVLNAATANSACNFPDGMVPKHATFRLVAAGNTTGHGADRVYVGRQQLDGALLDRFAVIHWEYDEDLEKALYPDVLPWVTYVQKVRRVLDAMPATTRPRTLVTARAIQQGAGRARRGEAIESLAERYVWRKFSTDDRKQVEKAL